MMDGLEALALLAAAAPGSGEGKGRQDGSWLGVGQLRLALRSASDSLSESAIAIIQRAAAGVSGVGVEGGGEGARGGVSLVVALRVLRGVAGPLLVNVRNLGPMLPNCRIPALAHRWVTDGGVWDGGSEWG